MSCLTSFLMNEQAVSCLLCCAEPLCYFSDVGAESDESESIGEFEVLDEVEWTGGYF